MTATGKDIYVVAEQHGGCLQKVGLELLGEARRLAAVLGQQVVALLMGHEVSQKAGDLLYAGANRVVLIDAPLLEAYVTEPCAKALAAVIERFAPEIVLFGATSIGRDLAPAWRPASSTPASRPTARRWRLTPRKGC